MATSNNGRSEELKKTALIYNGRGSHADKQGQYPPSRKRESSQVGSELQAKTSRVKEVEKQLVELQVELSKRSFVRTKRSLTVTRGQQPRQTFQVSHFIAWSRHPEEGSRGSTFESEPKRLKVSSEISIGRYLSAAFVDYPCRRTPGRSKMQHSSLW